MLADRIADIQAALAESDADGWLFACFQHNDPISLDLLGLGGDHLVSRRCYYLIPRQGAPRKLCHRLEPAMLDHVPGDKRLYLTWGEHREELLRLVAGAQRLAAQYSPENQLPSVSRLDAGTAELLRGAGVELLSSAELVQRFAAVWSREQLAGHRRACEALHRIVREAFERVAAALRGGDALDEHAVQRFILERFEQAGLWSESPPIVGVDAHSADPHYQPAAEGSGVIRQGDFLLIDLFAKEKAAQSVYADITWCAVCAAAPTDRQAEVWGVVAGARDAAWDLVRSRFPGETVRGFEVDDAARGVIEQAGYGERFVHRTGHSIGISDHGHGANMDNLETHDTRPLLPMTGFSIEPGIYLPGDFGVRSEIDVALMAEGAEITGAEPQRELLRLLA
ncbi:MAG TPA: M24 family metallopeptidase [Thermoanaerobaculia bacterium]|nr:M24 family metallopeptidase [Thermoanaerobaculia bacterium]